MTDPWESDGFGVEFVKADAATTHRVIGALLDLPLLARGATMRDLGLVDAAVVEVVAAIEAAVPLTGRAWIIDEPDRVALTVTFRGQAVRIDDIGRDIVDVAFDEFVFGEGFVKLAILTPGRLLS